MITPNKMEYFRMIKEIVDNDPHAIRFLEQARDASELYRRLDQGKPIDITKAKKILEAMSTEWVASPFVRNFYASISPTLALCIEKYKNEPNLDYCPTDIELLSVITYIFKGNEGVEKYMPKARELSNKIKKEQL